jgi:flagellar protein FlaG
MQSKVAPFAATPDPTFGRQPSPQPDLEVARPAPAPGGEEADLRLIIEEDHESGAYVYKTVNRRTGEVILQLPREEILKLREETQYVAGVVIRTRV